MSTPITEICRFEQAVPVAVLKSRSHIASRHSVGVPICTFAVTLVLGSLFTDCAKGQSASSPNVEPNDGDIKAVEAEAARLYKAGRVADALKESEKAVALTVQLYGLENGTVLPRSKQEFAFARVSGNTLAEEHS